MDVSQPVLLADGFWWVGAQLVEKNLQCNPYLLIQGGSSILFDAGSVLDFEVVSKQVQSLIDIDKLDAIVCSHQDPDLCSALPLFEEAGFKGVYCCHQRAANLIAFYGVKRPFYYVNFHEYSYPLADGTTIKFLPAPYLHFPGAIMSYLQNQKVLVSGDLFGSIGTNWQLYATDEYEEGMKTYHESYMPSHDLLKPVMDQLANYDIQMICPQHGSVINHNIQHYIDVLKDLQCGIFLNPVRKQLVSAGGYIALCNQIIKRYITIYGPTEVRSLFAKSQFSYNAKRRIIEKTKLPEGQIWNSFFDLVLERKGMGWITIMAPFVELMTKEYAITLPKIFSTIVFDNLADLHSKESELQELVIQKSGLEQQLHQLEESLYRDSITGLYNENFHKVFVKEAMEQVIAAGTHFHFIMMSIDNLAQINLDFGSAEGDNSMRRLATLIGQQIEPTSNAFRFAGAVFGIYCRKLSKEDAVKQAQNMLRYIAESEAFIVPITLSIGLFSTTELPDALLSDPEQMKDVTIQTARYRLKLAQKRGGGILVYESIEMARTNTLFTILLIDNPGLGRNIIKRALEKEGYRVIVASNGLEGRRMIEEESPDLIISELMVPKVNAITLRKELLAKPSGQNIPFLLMSYTKNESTVERAIDVRISHFFWRPVMLVEMLGVVNLIANRLQIQGN